MIEVEGKIKKWGNSMGLLLTKEAVAKENLKEGDKVKALVTKKKNPLEETFGIMTFSRPIAKILKEVDKEAWDD